MESQDGQKCTVNLLWISHRITTNHWETELIGSSSCLRLATGTTCQIQGYVFSQTLILNELAIWQRGEPALLFKVMNNITEYFTHGIWTLWTRNLQYLHVPSACAWNGKKCWCLNRYQHSINPLQTSSILPLRGKEVNMPKRSTCQRGQHAKEVNMRVVEV